MTSNIMRKFLVVIMDLIICILVEVQGNELSSTFFHHSSLPFSIPFAELDSDHGTIYNCLEENFAICEEKLKGGHDVLFRALAAVELNSYIAILDVPNHKKTSHSSGAIAKFFS